MNFNYYLSQFLINENYKHFNFTWSFPWMFGYLIPRTIWNLIGIEKPIPFALSYTRFVAGDNTVFMTVASAGVGEWIHNYSNILNFPVFLSILIGGIFCGFVFMFFKKIVDFSVYTKNIYLFSLSLILLHVGEPIFDCCFYTSSANFLANLGTLVVPLSLLAFVKKFLNAIQRS